MNQELVDELKKLTAEIEQSVGSTSSAIGTAIIADAPKVISFAEKAGTAVMSFLANFTHLANPRAAVILVVCAVLGWLIVPANMMPLVATAINLTLGVLLAAAFALIVRKILLDDKFKLQDHADKALEGNMASAVVFASVIGFMASIMILIAFKAVP